MSRVFINDNQKFVLEKERDNIFSVIVFQDDIKILECGRR